MHLPKILLADLMSDIIEHIGIEHIGSSQEDSFENYIYKM